MASTDSTYNIPGHIEKYLGDMGFDIPNKSMASYIDEWARLYRSEGEFWDYEEQDGTSIYQVHRRTIRPFKRVCVEWSSLILGDETRISTEDERCNEYLDELLPRIGFLRNGQALIQRSFGLGTGCWAVWLDSFAVDIQVRRYFANMMIPLSWDDDRVTEIALCTRIVLKGKTYDQLQLHLREPDGYHIRTLYFDERGEQVTLDGVIEDFPTGANDPWFAVVRPALDNDLVDNSPFGVSVFKDAKDALKAVDLSYDAMVSEVDLGKLRVFLSDMMFEAAGEEDGEVTHVIPFGKSDATIYRMGDMSGFDNAKPIHEFAPALRTDAQSKVYRLSLQTMGDLCGFGLNYFDIDDSGGLKTATEVSADNSQLMRNLRNHENVVQGAVEDIVRAVLQAANFLGEDLPDPGKVTVKFDDSIISDTASEKAQDMAEVSAGLMNPWEYRMKWYGEDEETARKNSPQAAEAPMLLG